MADFISRQLIVDAGTLNTSYTNLFVLSLAHSLSFPLSFIGNDTHNKPIEAMYGCHLPDAASTDYEMLLVNCRKRLDSIVAREYIIVFFAAGMKHRPSWKWMMKAYKTLSRE